MSEKDLSVAILLFATNLESFKISQTQVFETPGEINVFSIMKKKF